MSLFRYGWARCASHLGIGTDILGPNYYHGLTLTHWGRVTHIYVIKLTIIGSDNGLSPGRHQAIIWTIAGILLIGPFGTNFSNRNSYIFIQENAFENVVCEMASICLGLNVDNYIHYKMWDEITYAFSTFNGVAVEVWEWISNSISH